MTSRETSDSLLKKIRAKRRRIATFVEKLEPHGVRLTNLSIVCGAIATVLTAGPAIGGKTLTDALGAVGPNSPSWRILCGAAAVLSLIATIATNLYKSHDVASRLAKAQACDAKLEGLEILVELGQLPDKEAVTRYDACISGIDFPILERGRRRRAPLLDSVNGSIDQPRPKQSVEDAFLCAGEVHGLESGLYLWLAVEVSGRIWPKEGRVSVAEDGSWNRTVFEDGAIDQFSLSLFVANTEGDRHIRNWFDICDRAGNYPELGKIPGTLRLARINGLRRSLEA